MRSVLRCLSSVPHFVRKYVQTDTNHPVEPDPESGWVRSVEVVAHQGRLSVVRVSTKNLQIASMCGRNTPD